jgi:general secretion pathway protein A
MYLDYWRLKEDPFSNTLDLRFMHMTPQHSEAVARLLYVVKQHKAGAVLTGDYGTGKSLVRMLFLSKLQPLGNFAIALVDNPLETPSRMLGDIYRQISHKPLPSGTTGISYRDLEAALKARHANGFSNLVMVEEAQLIRNVETLEELRLLMNLSDDQGSPLLTMILIGQQAFLEIFKASAGLVQRLPARWHIEPLSRAQTRDYIDHRLVVAGANGWVFEDAAVDALYAESGGIARMINNVADMSLYLGMRVEASRVTAEIVERVVADLKSKLPALGGEEEA